MAQQAVTNKKPSQKTGGGFFNTEMIDSIIPLSSPRERDDGAF